MQLLTTRYFNGITLDCYVEPEQEDKGFFWATREQIGRLLDYEEPMKSVAKIHERHSERLSKFSTIAKLTIVEGGREVNREVFVYNFKGLLEICRYSNQPNANAVIDRLWDIADEIRRTGIFSIQKVQPVEPEFVAPKKSGYTTRATVKAIEDIIDRAFKCKKTEDFEAVIALDNVFRANHGYSVLEQAGLKLVKKLHHIEHDYVGCYVYLGDYEWEKSLLSVD